MIKIKIEKRKIKTGEYFAGLCEKSGDIVKENILEEVIKKIRNQIYEEVDFVLAPWVKLPFSVKEGEVYECRVIKTKESKYHRNTLVVFFVPVEPVEIIPDYLEWSDGKLVGVKIGIKDRIPFNPKREIEFLFPTHDVNCHYQEDTKGTNGVAVYDMRKDKFPIVVRESLSGNKWEVIFPLDKNPWVVDIHEDKFIWYTFRDISLRISLAPFILEALPQVKKADRCGFLNAERFVKEIKYLGKDTFLAIWEFAGREYLENRKISPKLDKLLALTDSTLLKKYCYVNEYSFSSFTKRDKKEVEEEIDKFSPEEEMKEDILACIEKKRQWIKNLSKCSYCGMRGEINAVNIKFNQDIIYIDNPGPDDGSPEFGRGFYPHWDKTVRAEVIFLCPKCGKDKEAILI